MVFGRAPKGSDTGHPRSSSSFHGHPVANSAPESGSSSTNLEPKNELFNVYPGSWGLATEDELRRSRFITTFIYVVQIFVARRGLWLEEKSGDSLLGWIGSSVNQYCLAFVALAFVLLSRILQSNLRIFRAPSNLPQGDIMAIERVVRRYYFRQSGAPLRGRNCFSRGFRTWSL
jgi:hypothetical protein